MQLITSAVKCCVLLLVGLALSSPALAEVLLEQAAAWRLLNFGNGDPRDSVATGVVVTGDKIFLSMPRVRENAPVTLAWTPRSSILQQQAVDPPLIPFPDWTWQAGHRDNCTGLVSVFRSRVDRCGRLWVLDSGTVNTSTRVCPARLFVFDPNTGIPLRVHVVPPQLLRETSVLPFMEFEAEPVPVCDAMRVYISDTLGYGLIVLDAMRGVFWRFEHPTFRNEPQLGTYEVAGEPGTTQDGILGLAVAYLGGQPMLFYRPFSSLTIYAVPTAALQVPNTQLPVLRVLQQRSQGVCMAAHGSRLLFSPLSDSNIVSWNTDTLQIRELIPSSDALQFVADMTVEHSGDIWLLSNRFQRFSNMAYNPAEINIRVLRLRRSSAFLPSLQNTSPARFTSNHPFTSYSHYWQPFF